VAKDGEEGIKAFAEQQKEIKLVLTDLGLPRITGEAMIDALKEMDPTVPIIVASGYLDNETRLKLGEVGVAGVIHKPFKPNELLRKVRDALDLGNGKNNR
jgi:DNA-binding response OmpR family regulator